MGDLGVDWQERRGALLALGSAGNEEIRCNGANRGVTVIIAHCCAASMQSASRDISGYCDGRTRTLHARSAFATSGANAPT